MSIQGINLWIPKNVWGQEWRAKNNHGWLRHMTENWGQLMKEVLLVFTVNHYNLQDTNLANIKIPDVSRSMRWIAREENRYTNWVSNSNSLKFVQFLSISIANHTHARKIKDLYYELCLKVFSNYIPLRARSVWKNFQISQVV